MPGDVRVQGAELVYSHPTRALIGKQITQAVSHAAATRLQRLAKSRRVRRQKQGRTRRIDQLLDVEHEAMPFGRIGNLPVGFREAGRRSRDSTA
jgi:hypothetical protein